MKKILLAGTALVGVAFAAAPAAAELKLDLGGHFSGYGVYVDQDNDTGFNDFEFRKNTEVHFTGETTLDNGLTVGVHIEQEIENNANDNESYAYFSGGWGRVNFGNEDGVAYLLQVAAPSADSNIDGLRSTISGIKTPTYGAFGALVPLAGEVAVAPSAGASTFLDYQHADFGNGPTDSGKNANVTRLSYMTPKFNGFQAGASYGATSTPSTGIQAMTNGTYDDLWEAAVRWDGQFEGVGISLGGGYSHASDDTGVVGADDLTTWNLGANLAWNQFSFGGSYLDSDNGSDSNTWVVGAAWDNGPYHLGVSYLDSEVGNGGLSYQESAVLPLQTNDAESQRITVGAGYTFGPGMTFRGAVAFGEIDYGTVSNAADATSFSAKEDFTQVTIGTDIQF